MKEISTSCRSVTGIDISEQSIQFAKDYLRICVNCKVICADVHCLDIESAFDVVLCLQNGLSAIKGGNASDIVSQAVKFLRPGGTAYFSSYSPKFWVHRLKWFQEQADKGLIGEIDLDKTKDGCIVCRDGFTARTIFADEFEQLGRLSGCEYAVTEYDDSIVFLILTKLV